MVQLTLLALVLGQTPSITVTAPTASSDVVVGTTFNITWDAVIITDVKIQLTTDDGASWVTTIADSVDSNDTGWRDFPWQVPDQPSTTCRIRISDYNAAPRLTSRRPSRSVGPLPAPMTRAVAPPRQGVSSACSWLLRSGVGGAEAHQSHHRFR